MVKAESKGRVAGKTLLGLLTAAATAANASTAPLAGLFTKLPRQETYLEDVWEDWNTWNRLSLGFNGDLQSLRVEQEGLEASKLSLDSWLARSFGSEFTRFSIEGGMGKTEVKLSNSPDEEVSFGRLGVKLEGYPVRGDFSPYFAGKADLSIIPFPMESNGVYSYTLSTGIVPFTGGYFRSGNVLLKYEGSLNLVFRGVLGALNGNQIFSFPELSSRRTDLGMEMHIGPSRNNGVDAFVLMGKLSNTTMEGLYGNNARQTDFDASASVVRGRLKLGAGIFGSSESYEYEGETKTFSLASAKAFLEYQLLPPYASLTIGGYKLLPKKELEGVKDWGIFGSIRIELPK